MHPTDIDERIWRAAVEHIKACEAAEHAADEIDDPMDWPPSPASFPYCGCDTCVMRETLVGAWPVIEDHFTQPAPRASHPWVWALVGAVIGWSACALGVVASNLGWL